MVNAGCVSGRGGNKAILSWLVVTCLFLKWHNSEQKLILHLQLLEKVYIQIKNLKKWIMKRDSTVRTGWSKNSRLLLNPHKHTTQHTDQTNCCWLAFFMICQQSHGQASPLLIVYSLGTDNCFLKSSTALLPEQPDRLVYYWIINRTDSNLVYGLGMISLRDS